MFMGATHVPPLRIQKVTSLTPEGTAFALSEISEDMHSFSASLLFSLQTPGGVMLTANERKTTKTDSNEPQPGGRLSTISAQMRLIQTVRLALRRSGHTELRNAEITADQRAVTISGRVPTFYLKQVAQELAKVAAPEHQIRNELDVGSI